MSYEMIKVGEAHIIIELVMHMFIENLNNIYLINNHIQHPTSQYHHPDKLWVAAIVYHIYWTPHKTHIHKVHAH